MSTMARTVLFFFSFLPTLIGLGMATQQFASFIEYDSAFLGNPILGIYGLYWPWKIISWYALYQQYVPDLFRPVMWYPLVGFMMTLLLLVIFRPKTQLRSHGTAHWAKYKDLLKMDLISGQGVVIGLWDNGMTKLFTDMLRSVELKKKETTSYGEIKYNEELEKETDKKIQLSNKLALRLDGLRSTSLEAKRMEKHIQSIRKWLQNPPKYKPKKYTSAWFWSLAYNKTFAAYTQLSHFYLRDNASRHISVVAPTRSGKGVGLIIPTLLGGWRESVIINDIKSENWGITAGYRKRMGQKVIKFEPTSADGSSARWNPLDEIHIGTPDEVSAAQNLAQIIANYEGKKGTGDHWIANAANVIFAVILHLKYAHYCDKEHYPTPPNLYTVASFLKSATVPKVNEAGEIIEGQYEIKDFVGAIVSLQNFEHVPAQGIDIEEWDTKTCQYVKRHFSPDDLHAMYPDDFANIDELTMYTHPIVNKAFIEISKKPDNELGSIVSTANTALKEYLDPILTMNTRCSDFCIDDMMNYKQPVSLYLITPPSDILRLSPIFRVFFEMMTRHHTKRIGEYKDGRCNTVYKHKCLLLLDEFAALGNLQSFSQTLAYTAGYGMKAMLILQGLPQLYEVYGKDNHILMNCGLQIYYAPNENDTASTGEKALGNETITVKSTSEQGFLKKNNSWSETSRPLLTADEFKRLGDREIIMVQDNPPVITDKIKYYEQRFFTRKLRNAPLVSDLIRTDKTSEVNNYNPKREALLSKQNNTHAVLPE